jgi:choline dehydrogenase-like flavoprotein
MAREVTVDDHGKATGVIYIDKTTGAENRVLGRSVVLAAGANESSRLLLNSKSSLFPQGLANSSGKVGRYITDSVASSLNGQIPLLENLPIHNEDGAVGPHAYVPWWLYSEQKTLDFPGGYHLEFTSGRHMPTMTVANGFDAYTGRSGYAYGKQFKEDARRFYGSTQGFTAQGAMIPNENSFCELDPAVKDKWGIPVLRFHWQWSDYEMRQVEHQQKSIAALIEAMGGKLSRKPATDATKVVRSGGEVIHEVGGAIMGDDPKKSVTNAWSQTWEVKNLIVADGGVFANTANKNPTLTIMALAWRAADHLLEEMGKGNI